MPDDWDEFSVLRVFRNIKYQIHVHRIGKGNDVKVIADGIELQSNIIPLPPNDVSIVNVTVEIGCVAKVPLVQQNKRISTKKSALR